MGRELRRKDAKKNGRDLKEKPVKEKIDWKKYSLTFSIVVIFFLCLYFILAIFVTKELDFSKKDNDTSNDTTSDNNTNVANGILANSIFKQKEDVYYVYCFDFNDQDTNVSHTVSNNLLEEKVYRVNTSDSMNSNYIGDVDKSVTTLEGLKISNPTLLKIENGKITMFLSGENEIINHYK